MKEMLTDEEMKIIHESVMRASKESADVQEEMIRLIGIDMLIDIYGEMQLAQLFEKAYARRLEIIWCNNLRAKKVSAKFDWHNDPPVIRIQVLER